MTRWKSPEELQSQADADHDNRVDSGTEVTQPILHGKVGGEDRLLTEQCGFCGAMAGHPCVEVEFESIGTEVAKKPACPSCCADWIAKGYNVPGELCPQCSLRPQVDVEKLAHEEAEEIDRALVSSNEVQRRMDAVVDAAVAWCESGEEGESVADSFEKSEALSNAVYRLKQLRSKPVTCDQPSQPEISSSQVVKEAWACIWEENIDAVWLTSCGNAYQFTNGGPSDNRAEYCIYCGKPISELALADEQEAK